MSFKATFYVEGHELNVLDCEYSISQPVDYNGKPSARSKGGLISVLVESTRENFLFDWSASETQVKSGSIVFYRRDSLAKLKELRFEDAYCIEFSEHFTAQGERPMQIELMLSAKRISLGGSSELKNPWPAG